MKRFHLFEIHDYPWCPTVFRDAVTGYLGTLTRLAGASEKILPFLEDAVQRTGAQGIVDLCAGDGSGTRELHQMMREPVDVILTDLYPNQQHPFQVPGISVYPESVDARKVPKELTGLRTLFNAFHHFKPAEAREILQDATKHADGILIVELSERSLITVLSAPTILIFTLLMMPLVRPMQWQYIVFTYFIPILPFLIFWDGLVSHLRAYTRSELKEMTDSLDAPHFAWEMTRVPMGPGVGMTVLMGVKTAVVEG